MFFDRGFYERAPPWGRSRHEYCCPKTIVREEWMVDATALGSSASEEGAESRHGGRPGRDMDRWTAQNETHYIKGQKTEGDVSGLLTVYRILFSSSPIVRDTEAHPTLGKPSQTLEWGGLGKERSEGRF